MAYLLLFEFWPPPIGVVSLRVCLTLIDVSHLRVQILGLTILWGNNFTKLLASSCFENLKIVWPPSDYFIVLTHLVSEILDVWLLYNRFHFQKFPKFLLLI